MPTCWNIAGPNGVGKTTLALEYLPEVSGCRRFVNADLIAAGLSPLSRDQHLLTDSRLFLGEIESCMQTDQDVAFETTLVGRSHLKLIKRLLANGLRVVLIYLALPHVSLSKLRVAERVRHGGHNISLKDIERRFPRSLDNLLTRFSAAVDLCQCYMNSDSEPLLIFEQQGAVRDVLDATHYKRLQQEAGL